MNPKISIVIPTHNRSSHLLRTLEALGQQTEDHQNFEVIVVADGCQDNTSDAVKSLSTSYHLALIEQPDSGPASARNRGAKAALAPILLFLDDDVEPETKFVKAHLDAHNKWPGGVILGYSPFSDELDKDDLINQGFRDYWETLFSRQAQEEHRFNFMDLTTANVSISCKLFNDIGCFDERFDKCAYEDSEFGLRLLKKHVRFRFVKEATGKHHAKRSEDVFYKRYFNYGRTHVIFIRKHPEILPLFPFAYIVDKQKEMSSVPGLAWHLYPNRFLFKVMWLNPVIGKIIARSYQVPLKFFKYYNKKLYFKLNSDLVSLLYWIGVQAEVGSYTKSKQLANEALKARVHFNEIAIDLETEFSQLEQLLGKQLIDGARLRYNDQEIARIEPVVGTEALRPPHVYEAIQNFIMNSKYQNSIHKELAFLVLPFLPKISNAPFFNQQLSIDQGLKLDQGWHESENWNGTNTRWITEKAILPIYSNKICITRMEFRARSYYHSRTLEIYLGDQLAGRWIVPTKFIDINTEISLDVGHNILRLCVLEGCDRPCNHWRPSSLLNPDSRCLSIAFQNFKLISIED